MTAILANYDGFWWPASDTDARGVLTADVQTAVPALLKHIRGRDLIVQAGANVGLFPLALRDAGFLRVETYEPDPMNYECLLLNLHRTEAGRSGWRIWHHHAALGEVAGFCDMVPVKRSNCGAHRVDFEAGKIPVMTIDGQNLPVCDAIWVDCEGSELFVLRGAVETIDKFSPVICAEDKGLGGDFFNLPPGALQDFLSPLGYTQVDKIGRDKVFKRVG